MTKYGIVTSKPPSLVTVAKDIVHVLEKHGHQTSLFTRKIQWYDARKEFDRGIVFIPFDPLYAQLYFLLARDYCTHRVPSVIYTTVEGQPKKWLIRDWVKRDCVFIANSHFTEQMLKQVGVRVRKIIYHGVNISAINLLKTEAETRKQRLKQELGVKVLFGTVASGHPRKGMKNLANALKIMMPEIPDAGFYVLTTTQNVDHFRDIPRVKVLPHFGDLERSDVLTLIGAFDYLVHPALCEGFCLPILEAQAFGVPCIFPRYAPITEIAHPTANFPFKISSESYKDLGDGILYLCHHYEPEEMISQIAKAYETYTCNPEGYEKLQQQVKEQAQGFDILKLYPEFLKT
jgi:glycosyltransferase involved in cell wall biosynthesis